MPSHILLLAAVLLPAAVAALLVPLLRGFALRKRWVDVPDQTRKLHAHTVPNVGGVAIVISFTAGFLFLNVVRQWLPFEPAFWSINLWIAVVFVHIAGLYDDVRGLNFKAKFLVQIIAAYLLLQAGYHIEVADLPFVSPDPYEQALITIPLTWIWIVGVSNAVNLLDGLDGLAAGVVTIAFTSLAVVYAVQGSVGTALLALPIVGALLGFLLYNSNPASIFMGDSGSLFLGLLLAAFSLQGQVHTDPLLALLVPIVALGLPVFDTMVSIVRRLAHRKAVFAPDADHIHHRLVRRWSSQRKAVLALYAIAIVFGTVSVCMALATSAWGWTLFAATLVVVLIGLRMLGYLTLAGRYREYILLSTVTAVERGGVDERPHAARQQDDVRRARLEVEQKVRVVENKEVHVLESEDTLVLERIGTRASTLPET